MRLVAPVEERPYRRPDDFHRALRRKALDHLVERDVALLGKEPQNEVRMRVELEAARLSLAGRFDASRRPLAPRPFARRRLADRKSFGRFAGRHAAFDRRYNPFAQIHAVGFAHHFASRSLQQAGNQRSKQEGIPYRLGLS